MRSLAGGRGEPAVAHELGEQLGVVHDLVAAAEVRVLVAERVEAVRAAWSTIFVTPARFERLDVLLGEGLEDVLVAHPPGGVAGAGLARAEDGEVDAGGLQQLRGRLGRRAGALVERGRAADPVEHLRRRVARLEHAHVQALAPSRRARTAACPTGSTSARRRAASARPRPGSATRPSPGGGAGRRCGRRARSRPGTPATQAPQVTQSQTTSSVTAFGTSGGGAAASPAARAASRPGPSANTWSRRPMISSFGESALPVA